MCIRDRGNPGVVVDLEPGLFSLYVDNEGCLRLVWSDGEPQPPLRIQDGHLIYSME